MKAIMVMFDSLNRHFLEPYSTATGTHTPNFLELARRTVQFERCYAGSLPCMPARRELHTGRYNFLHTYWGNIEPFDDSMPKLLNQHGIHTHLVSDHYHYWENGGSNYHCQYKTWEAIRGQEGDPWIAKVGGVDTPRRNHRKLSAIQDLAQQDVINRTVWSEDEEERPIVRTFSKGLEFLEKNHAQDNWFLTIETFDPHEPFDAPQRLKDLYPDDYEGPLFDWDNYGPVTETPEEVKHLRNCYKALVTFCDEQLGRVVQFMDQHQMWDDTMLIVNDDHGHFVSERGFWAKNYMPSYREIANLPLFIWDPRIQAKGVKREALVQTIDIPATLLDFFNVPIPVSMQGKPIVPVLQDDTAIRNGGLFGYFGQMICMVNGDYVFMRAPQTPDNSPLYKYTFMLHNTSGVDPKGEFSFTTFPFTKGFQVPRVPMVCRQVNELQRHDLLFNIREDPGEERPIQDKALLDKMCQEMARLLKQSDAPEEQYVRMGLTEYL